MGSDHERPRLQAVGVSEADTSEPRLILQSPELTKISFDLRQILHPASLRPQAP